MDKKLETKLSNFRYNSLIVKNTFTVEWFRYDLNESLEENISAFDDADLKLFQNYVVANTNNFSGPKNYFTPTEGDIPIEDIYDWVADERLEHPDYLIIKPEPTIDHSGKISRVMEIILLSPNGEENHTFNLPFGVIGRILPSHS